MQKSLALIAKQFKNIYRPTNNNLETSSNTMNKNMDTSPRTGNDRQTGKFRNQRTVIVAGNKETIGNQVVQQSEIQCFNCKGLEHFAKECRKPKKVKDYEYHREKMMLCKQESKGPTYDAELLEKAHTDDDYIVFATERQHSEKPESISDTYSVFYKFLEAPKRISIRLDF
ncbi:retrovirus-related pol polyprotein from transposon TNT 1-94 [Tanacetum coccineum]